MDSNELHLRVCGVPMEPGQLLSELAVQDPHVKKDGVKSILSMPIVNQGKLVAILYVENSVVTHAFTPKRLGLLHVIAGQAAISIAITPTASALSERVDAALRLWPGIEGKLVDVAPREVLRRRFCDNRCRKLLVKFGSLIDEVARQRRLGRRIRVCPMRGE